MKFMRRVPGILAVGLPVALAIAYRVAEHAHQRNDESNYLLQTQNTYFSIRALGLLHGSLNAYLARDFRPILHPFLATPFFFLTGGEPNLAVSIYIGAMYACFVYCLLKLLREFLPRLESLIGTVTIALLPAVLMISETFKSELSLLTFFTAFLLALKRCQFFHSRMNSLLAGVFLGAAICIRPTESVLYGGLITLVYVLSAIHGKQLAWKDLAVFLGIAAIGLATLSSQVLAPSRSHEQNWVYLLPALLPIGVFAFRKKLGLSDHAWRFFAPLSALPILWYAPVAKELYGWAWVSAFSDWAKLTGYREGVSKLAFFEKVAGFCSWPVFIVAAILLVFQGPAFKRYRDPLLLVLPAIFLPVVLASFSYNGDPKNYLLSGILASLTLMILVLSPEGRLHKLRLLGVSAVALLLIGYRVSVIRQDRSQVEAYHHTVMGPHLSLPISQDEIEPLYASFAQLLPHASPQTPVNVCLLQLLPESGQLDWVADPWDLTVMSHQRGENWEFLRPYPMIRDTTDERFAWVLENCDFISVLPIRHKINGQYPHFMTDVGERVLSAWQEKRLKQDQLVLDARADYRANEGTPSEYLLFRSLRRKR